MTWYNKYKNIPFKEKGRDENGVDCWGLVFLIYKNELGIELPDYLFDYDTTDQRAVLSKLIEEEKSSKWETVETPKEFDVVVLRMRGVPMHVGVVTKKNYMIHCAKGVDISHEHYGTARWKHKVAGFERWKT